MSYRRRHDCVVLLTSLLNECRTAGIETADVASWVKSALSTGSLTVPKLASAIGTLQGRKFQATTTTKETQP